MFTTPRQKKKGYVYCNGKLIARQDPNWILWQHENPFSGTRAISSRDGLGGVEIEPDALGVDMGLFDPFPVPEQWEPPVDGLVGLLPTSGIPSGRCILDGIPIFCADAEHLLSIGAAQFKPPDTVWDGERWRFVEFNRDRREYVYHVNTVLKKFTVKENEEDDGETYYGRVRYYNRVTVMSDAEELFSLFAFRPSRTSRKKTTHTAPQNPQPAPDKDGIAGNLETALKDTDCSGFIKNLLARVATEGNPLVEGGDLLKILNLITAPGQYGLQRGGNDPRSGAQILGSVGSGKAGIAFGIVQGGYVDRGGEALRQILLYHDSISALHELIHLAGKNVYDDLTLAKAASGMPNASELGKPPAGSDALGIALFYSDYFNTELRKHCKNPRLLMYRSLTSNDVHGG